MPISLTCVLCIVLEHIVSSSVANHFTDHSMLYHLQHGLWGERSRVTQIVMLVNDIHGYLSLQYAICRHTINQEKVLLKCTN